MANPHIEIHQSAAKKTLWAWAIGTFFGAGLLKPGPGTYGSIAALVLWFTAANIFHPTPIARAIGTSAAALIAMLIGIPAATIVARECGREDPGLIVIDEVAGQFFALVFLPADWPHAALALLLFRVLDIFKPPPIGQLERLHGGLGIMLDDVAAGLIACILAQLLLLVVRSPFSILR